MEKNLKTKKQVARRQELERLNAKVEEIVEDLSSRGKFLPSDAIFKVVLDLVLKSNQQTGLGIKWRDVEAYNQFSRLHGRIDELIRVYCMFTPVTSLHELGVAIAHAENVAKFEDLHFGPLVKHPRARDFFRPPEELDAPPEITVHQLHSYLTEMIDRSNRGTKFSLKDFLEFVRKEQDAESVEHLCVRIQSFPLLIQVCLLAMPLFFSSFLPFNTLLLSLFLSL